ncbi:MAG: DNA/RNA nuclease SfsA [bacterium]
MHGEAEPVCVPLGRGAELVEATFIDRPNRFLVRARLDGHVVEAHLADRGRLAETLLPGVGLVLARATGAARKTQFQAVAAWRDGALASIDTQLPNRLVEAALRARALAPFARYDRVRPEAKRGASRFDFEVSNAAAERCTIEVKSVGLELDGIGLFPDAPTSRGLRHLAELAELARGGEPAAVVFVVPSARARAMRVHRAIDPDFAVGLVGAASAGVEVLAYACPLTLAGIVLGPRIPVLDLAPDATELTRGTRHGRGPRPVAPPAPDTPRRGPRSRTPRR